MTFRRSQTMLLFFVCHVISRTSAYSFGPTDDACSHMIPGHGFPPQSSPSPYTVTADSTEYTPGQEIQVTLDGGGVFKGFYIQVRRADPGSNQEELIGSFITGGVPDVRLACGGKALCHSASLSVDTLTLTWTAPQQYEGNLEFRASFVRDVLTYWVAVKSVILTPGGGAVTAVTDDVTDGVTATGSSSSFSSSSSSGSTRMTSSSSTPAPTTTPSTPTPQPPPEIDLSTCGINKGCYRTPDDCQVDTCDYLLTWTQVGDDDVMFEMSGSVEEQNYIAVGFSKDTLMGDDSVTECIIEDSTVRVRSSYNLDNVKVNRPLSNPSLGLDPSSFQGAMSDGKITCSFRRQKALTGGATKDDTTEFFNISQPFYLIMAKGRAFSGIMLQHDLLPTVSTNTTNVGLGVENLGGTTISVSSLIKAHGALMIFAWMFFTSFAIILPRYYKETLDLTCCGKALWFQLHQPFMVFALLCTVAGFILVFVHVMGYSQLLGSAAAHPPLGIIATAFVIINPLMALCRPAPDSPKRPVFYWFHFLIGRLGHITAAAAIVIACYNFESVMDEWCRWVSIAWLAWHVLVEITLLVHYSCTQRTSVKEIEMAYYNRNDKSTEAMVTFGKQKKGKGFKMLVLLLHTIVCLGCSIAIVVSIARA